MYSTLATGFWASRISPSRRAVWTAATVPRFYRWLKRVWSTRRRWLLTGIVWRKLRRLIWSFTDSLEQDTCSNYQKVRYVCKCVMRKMSFMQTAVLPFTWSEVHMDGSGHQPWRIINATPAGPKQTMGTSTSKNHKCDTCKAKADDRDFNLKETKKEYGKESTGLCELLHEAEIWK